MKQKVKNLADIRNIAVDYLNQIMEGKADLDEIDAFCRVSNIVMSTLKAEMQHAKLIDSTSSLKFIENEKI